MKKFLFLLVVGMAMVSCNSVKERTNDSITDTVVDTVVVDTIVNDSIE